MTPSEMLENAATASQNKSLLDDPVTRGAILRAFHQWIVANDEGDVDFLKFSLTRDPDFQS